MTNTAKVKGKTHFVYKNQAAYNLWIAYSNIRKTNSLNFVQLINITPTSKLFIPVVWYECE